MSNHDNYDMKVLKALNDISFTLKKIECDIRPKKAQNSVELLFEDREFEIMKDVAGVLNLELPDYIKFMLSTNPSCANCAHYINEETKSEICGYCRYNPRLLSNCFTEKKGEEE